MFIRTRPFSAADVVNLLGDIQWTSGDLSRQLSGIAPIRAATSESLTYCRYSGDALLSAVRETSAGLVIVPDSPDLRTDAIARASVLVAVRRPRLAFIRALNAFGPIPPFQAGVAKSAIIASDSRVDPLARVEDRAIIGPRCAVGARSIIGAGTILYGDVQIGEDCIIDPGCVLGADGFSFERRETGQQEDFPHFGRVVIGNDVRIGAQCCVDRGSIDDTIIEDHVRIDNHSQVSHNCIVHARSVLCGFVVLGGSVTIGHDAWISPHVVIRNQLAVGPRAVVGLGAVVMKDVAADDNVLGNPARRVPELKGVRSSG